MGFRVLADSPRRPHVDFYRRHPSPFYSVTFELDATLVRARAKALGASTFAAMVWAYHRALVAIDAFRTRLHGDQIVLYDSLAVGMAVPGPSRTFTFATLDWDADAPRFLGRAAERIAAAARSVDLSGGAAPDFAYYTSLPKVPFTSFTHVALPDPTAGQPETAFGKFREVGGRTLVPVGVLVNHLFVDGADLGELYEGASASFARGF
jgi:chloramphenicol O-acetyltransferase type A